VLVLWSKNAKTSRWLLDEAEHAARKAVLVQLIIEDTEKDVLPLSFGSLHAIVCEWSAPGELGASSREKLLAAVRPHVFKGGSTASTAWRARGKPARAASWASCSAPRAES
jgi:hypothetical protein